MALKFGSGTFTKDGLTVGKLRDMQLMVDNNIGADLRLDPLFDKNQLYRQLYSGKTDPIHFTAPNFVPKDLREAISYVEGRVDPDSFPSTHRFMTMEMMRSFIWGPHGEWTGISATGGELASVKCYRAAEARGFEVGLSSRNIKIDLKRYVEPNFALKDVPGFTPDLFYNQWTGYGVQTVLSIPIAETARLSFHSYDDLASLLGTRGENSPMEHKMFGLRRGLELAGLLSLLCISPEKSLLWNSSLKTENYKLGFGVLRDSEDHFDLLGMLWDMNDGEWYWDDLNSGYAAEKDGDATAISAESLRKVLNIPNYVSDTAIDYFVSEFGKIVDTYDDFDHLKDDIEKAQALIDQRREMLREAMKQTLRRFSFDDCGVLGAGDHTADAMCYAMNFYNKDMT